MEPEPDIGRRRQINEDGVLLFSKGNYSQALENFDYALTLNAQDPILLYNMAQCYDRLGNAKLAEQYYSSCLQREPKHADAESRVGDRVTAPTGKSTATDGCW